MTGAIVPHPQLVPVDRSPAETDPAHHNRHHLCEKTPLRNQDQTPLKGHTVLAGAAAVDEDS